MNIHNYTHIIRTVLARASEPFHHLDKNGVDTVLVEDDQSNNFLLLRIGWHNQKRMRNTIFHLRIKGDSIHIEQDNTDYPLVDELVEAGVPRSDIVLAFHPPELRHLTDFAVA